MTEDSVTEVAIMGAGPIGLDAALAASEAGMDFLVLEQGQRVAANIGEWGHVRLFSPWSFNVSPRMASALKRMGRQVPSGGPPTGAELIGEVLEPLASAAWLGSRVRTGGRVISVGREGLLKHEEIGTGRRGDRPFRILYEDSGGAEHVVLAHIVLDCTGTWNRPNRLGQGGTPAVGERRSSGIVRRIPDFVSEEADWAGRRILLVGAGHSAFTAARGLAGLASDHPDTRVTWVLRDASPSFAVYDDDPLPARSELVRRAESLASGGCPRIQALTGRSVHEIEESERQTEVRLIDTDGVISKHTVDRVLSLIGSVGDRTLYRQLQVHECYATEGPMKLAATLLASGGGADCLAQESHGADVLANPEPNFYILGSKSYGRNTTFLLRVGFDQVTEVFAELTSRANVTG